MKQISQKTRLLIATGFCFYFYFAMSVARGVYSTLAPFLVDYYGTTLTESSLFTMAENVGFIVIMLLITVIADRIDKAWLMAALCGTYGVALLLMGQGPSFALLLALLVVTGMLGRYIDTLCTAYISDLYGEQRSHYMSLLLILFYIGSTLAPNLNTLVIEVWQQPWYVTYIISGVLLAGGTVLYLLALVLLGKPALAVGGASAAAKKKPRIGILQMLKNRNMLVLFVSNIVSAISMYFSSQLTLFLAMTNAEVYNTATRGLIATAGSAGCVVGSALYVWISKRMRAEKYLRLEVVSSFAISLLGILINNPYAWMVLRFLASAIGGGSFTARTLLTCQEFPEYSSSAIAVISVASGIASIFSMPALNALAERTSFSFAMYFSLLFSIGTWALLRFGYKPHAPEQEQDQPAAES